MATPVKYAQQYIPTSQDIGLMNQQLGALQGRYDAAYAAPMAFSDAASQIQTVGAENAAGKQAVINKFQDNIQSVVDRYGGDYGAASKDIVRAISKERQNPFYQLAGQHAQAYKEATARKNQLGAYAFVKQDVPQSFVDKEGNITSDDFNYDIQDVRSYGKEIAQMAKEASTVFNKQINEDAGNGYIRMVEQFGAANEQEAMNYLTTEPGQRLIQQTYSMYDAQPGESPQLDAYIQSTLMGNLIGDRKTNLVQDLDQAAARRSSSKTQSSSYGPSFVPASPDKGLKVLGGTRGRDKKNMVDLLVGGESSYNPRIRKNVNEHTTTRDTWVYGTGLEQDVEGKIKKGGQKAINPVTISNGKLHGYYSMYEILDFEGDGPKAEKKISSARENNALSDLGKGALFSRDMKGDDESPLGINFEDQNVSFEGLNEDRPYVVINSGTDEQMKVYVGRRDVRRYTDDKGRTVLESIGAGESMRAFGRGHGNDLIGQDGRYLQRDKSIVNNHAANIINQIKQSNPTDANGLTLVAKSYLTGAPSAVPDVLKKYYDFLIQNINEQEFQSYPPLVPQEKFTSEEL